MENKKMIQAAKWLIVAGLLCPICEHFSFIYQSIDSLVYRDIIELICFLLQTIGWILLLVSSKDAHWKLASGVFSFFMAACSVILIYMIVRFYGYMAQYNSDSYNVHEEYSPFSSTLYSYILVIRLAVCVVAIPALSVGGSKRYKASVSACLIAVLYPCIITVFNLIDYRFLDCFNLLDYSNRNYLHCNYLQRISFYIPGLFYRAFAAFAFGRMITLYERGEGTSYLPLQLKKIFTSRSFWAIVFFIFVFAFTDIFVQDIL
jgi:hypothetical protein